MQARAGAEASVARAQANLTKALEQLSYAQLNSDFAGVVTAVGATSDKSCRLARASSQRASRHQRGCR